MRVDEQQRNAIHTCGCPSEDRWFLEVARTETFGELVDVDAICDWYSQALPLAGAPDLTERFTSAITDLAPRSPADFVGRGDDLILAPFGDDDPDMADTSVVGVVLGFWPPTTAAFYLRHRRSGFERYQQSPLRWWTNLRFHVLDALEDVPVA